MGISGLNLGGADKDPATPPSGPAETKAAPENTSAPVKDTAKASESALEGDTTREAAAKLGDTRADDETKTLVEQPQTKPTESQADANQTVEVPKTAGEIADAVAAADSTLREDVAARWSSHPIMRYTVGNYHFENGLLVLRTQKEADEFQKVFDDLPIYEKSRLNKIDLSAAEAMVRERIATGGGATKGIDSSTGDRAPNKQVGSGDLITG